MRIAWKHILVFTSMLAIFTLQGYAQNVQFSAAVNSNNLTVGEKFKLEFTLNNQGSNFSAPDLSDFRLISGPSPANRVQNINGKVSYQLSLTYIFMAVKEGSFTIGPASIVVNGKKYESNTIDISVGANQSSSGSQPKKSNEGIFIRALVSKSNPYVGEALTVTLRLYTKEQILQYNMNKMPSLNGFWSEDVEIKQNQKFEVINGIRYQVVDLRQMVLFPQRSGNLTIDPFELVFIVRKRTNSRSQDIFDQFFGTGFQDIRVNVESDPVAVNVKPLSSNAPKGFSGAVGKFEMEVSANKNVVKTNESIDLKVVISGVGNMKLLKDPIVELPTDFEVYDPEIDDKLTTTPSGVTGTRTYKYLIIPRHKGEYTIDPIEFSYFNPDNGKYTYSASEPIEIVVEKGESDEVNPTYSNIRKEDVELIGNDIRFIKNSAENLDDSRTSFYGSTFFYSLLILPIGLLIVVLLIRNYYRELYSDKTRLRSTKATGVAKKRLSFAKKHLDKQELPKFYEEISKALYGYISDKLNINFSELNKEKIKELMLERKVEEVQVNNFLAIIETCDMARFAPVSTGSAEELYKKASENIKSIENQLK